MAHAQHRSNKYRRNGNSTNSHRQGRRSHPHRKQPLQDIDGNIVMSGMATAAPSPAPFNPPHHQGSNSSQGGKSRRRNRNRNRNRDRDGQNGQVVKPDISPMNVHAHPQMGAQLDSQAFEGQAEPNWIAETQHHTALQVASTPAPDYSWSSPIKYVHMNGELTPVDNCGDVIMGEAPCLDMGYSVEYMSNEHMFITALSNEIGNLQLFQ